MTRTAVKIKGQDRYGHVFEGDEFCKEQEVFRYFVESGTGKKLYDNFDRWEIKDGELDLYAHPERHRPLVVKGDGFLFIG